MSGEKWAYMQTYSGLHFYPDDPHPDQISIEDIAVALSREPRFAGHTREFYSVAQHSWEVSNHCASNPLWGLLHDAAEAYMKDMPWPVKRLLPEYKVLEWRLMRVITEKFGLRWPEPAKVKEADLTLLATERRDFFGVTKVSGDYDPLPYILKPWPPMYARCMFLDKFRSLTGG